MSSVNKMDSDRGGGGGHGGHGGGQGNGNADYDWSSEENAGKWRGLFQAPLHKVLIQVHPQFTAKDDALEYVENLLIKLLAMLTAKPVPVSVSDVEVRGKFDNWKQKYVLETVSLFSKLENNFKHKQSVEKTKIFSYSNNIS